MRIKFCPAVWAEQLTNKFFKELLHLQQMDMFVWLRCEQQKSCACCKVIGFICLTLLMTMHIYLQSWAGAIYLEIQKHLSSCTKINLSLRAFFFPPALPMMWFLSVCRYLLCYSLSSLRSLYPIDSALANVAVVLLHLLAGVMEAISTTFRVPFLLILLNACLSP